MANTDSYEHLRARWSDKKETIETILKLVREKPDEDWTPHLAGLEYLHEVSPTPLADDPAGGNTTYGRDLRGVDLQGYDLSGICLRHADLSGAMLEGAPLIRADLSRAKLVDANLRGADLNGANLNNVSLRNAILSDASVEGVQAKNSSLIRGNLKGACLDKSEFSGADFSSANMEGTSLRGTTLTGAVFDGANLNDISVDMNTVLWVEKKWSLWRSRLATEIDARCTEERARLEGGVARGRKYTEAARYFAAVQNTYHCFRVAYERAGVGDKAAACRHGQMVCGRNWRFRLSSVLGEGKSQTSGSLAEVHRWWRRGMRGMDWVLFDLTCKYGDSLGRVVLWSGLIVLLFAGVFWMLAPCVVRIEHDGAGLMLQDGVNTQVSQDYSSGVADADCTFPPPGPSSVCPRRATKLDAFYLSAVTFTTLGPGDISLCHRCDRGILTLAIAMEAFLGCFFMSVTAGVFVYRVTRTF